MLSVATALNIDLGILPTYLQFYFVSLRPLFNVYSRKVMCTYLIVLGNSYR